VFCQRIKTSAGRGSGTEGVLSITWLVTFQWGTSCRVLLRL